MENKRNLLIVLALILAVALFGWFFTGYHQSTTKSSQSPLIEIKDDMHKKQETFGISGEDTILVKIFYPSEDGIVAEERIVPNKPLPVTMAEAVLNEYLKGLKGGYKNTKLLGVYRDRNNVFYIDLSDEFRRYFSGDAREEYYLLKSLFDTVVSNVAGAEDVRLLIDGKEVESIGGHFYSLYGLKRIFAN